MAGRHLDGVQDLADKAVEGVKDLCKVLKNSEKFPGLNPFVTTPEGFTINFNAEKIPETNPLPKTSVQEHYLSEMDGLGDGKAGKIEGTGNIVTKLEPRGNPIDYPIEVRQDQIALQTYEKLRSTGLDVQEIQTFAKNTGLSFEEAKALKEHMILTKHENLVNQYEGTYYSDYFHPVWDVAHGWERALKGELPADEKAYFRKLADHELVESQLMKQGVPYRDVGGIENQKFTGDPPGAHELAPPQPDDYPNFRPDMRDPK